MCKFLSAVKAKDKNGKTKWYFLTHDLIHNTPRGDMIQKKSPGTDEVIGHVAIRAYFELRDGEGENWECANFLTPKNFPKILVKSIKRGDFRGFGTPSELLNKTAWAEYERITQTALAEYKRITQTAWAEYERITQPAWAEHKRITQTAWAEYKRITQPVLEEYERITQPVLAEYERITQTALEEYERITQPAFWDLFAKPENRNPEWNERR